MFFGVSLVRHMESEFFNWAFICFTLLFITVFRAVSKFASKWFLHEIMLKLVWSVNPFVPSAPFLYPQKTENRKVFWYFQGIEKGCIGNLWVKAKLPIIWTTVSWLTLWVRWLVSVWWSEFKGISEIFPLKSLENHQISSDFRENRS